MYLYMFTNYIKTLRSLMTFHLYKDNSLAVESRIVQNMSKTKEG